MIKRQATLQMWESDAREPLISVTIGRAVNIVLALRPKKLHEFFSRHTSFDSQLSSSSPGTLEDSACLLQNYVEDSFKRDCNLDDLLVPLIQHWLRNRDMKHGGQAVVIIDWLLQNEQLSGFVVLNFADIILKKDDRYIALGWCILTRVLLEYESLPNQYTLNGLIDNHITFVKLLCSCVPKLLQIVREGSVLHDGVELPSRLSLSAADCLIALSVELTKRTDVPNNQLKLLPSRQKKAATKRIMDKFDVDTRFLLWNQLDELIALLQKLHCWSQNRWTLHAVGVERVRRWLLELKKQYSCVPDEQSDTSIQKRGWLLLSSCWKHYGILLHLEDPTFSNLCNELLEQYIAGVQHYTHNDEDCKGTSDDAVHTRKFFLNCICLLLGRFDGKKLKRVISENMMQILQVVLAQLHSVDDDLVAAAVSVFKALVLNPEFFGPFHIDNDQMNNVLLLLLDLLDERDDTSLPIVQLIAKFCSMNISKCLEHILDRLNSKENCQRKNILCVLSELSEIREGLGFLHACKSREFIVDKLIAFLRDDEQVNRENASNVLAKMEPSLVLPKVFWLAYAPTEKIQTVATNIMKRMLTNNVHDLNVIRILVDCMSNRDSSSDSIRDGLKRESDPLYAVVLDWSACVENWEPMIPSLLEIMFSEPENSSIVRFMSYIREHLAEAADFVMYHVLSRMKRQKGRRNTKQYDQASPDSKQDLFDRLSPLLVIRMLPLNIFDNLESSIIYGKGLEVTRFTDDQESVVGCLINRAFNASEFDEVRRLAAELCGRIHPKVLFPIVVSSLTHATIILDTTMIKASLFSVCTALVLRGRDASTYSSSSNFILSLEKILLLPSGDADEVFKAQHGCIDCLALAVCADLQTSASDSASLVLDYVRYGLVGEKQQLSSSSSMGATSHEDDEKPLPFRLCMANVLISVCQKISDSSRPCFAKKALPHLIHSLKTISHPEVRAACIQVLFSAVYHLKSAIIPFSRTIFEVSLQALSRDSPKERMAGAKLMAALMSADEVILKKIAGNLLEATALLSNLSSSDSDDQLRELCQQLLACLTFN